MIKYWMAAFVAMLSILGCSFGKITYVEPPSAPRPGWGCDLDLNVCGFQRGVPVEVRVWGEGVCSLARLNFGDGQFIEGANIDLGKSGAQTPWVVSHTYQGWPGLKTLTAEGVTNCVGKETQSLHVFQSPPNHGAPGPETFILAFAAHLNTCDIVPNTPPLRRNTRVSVRTSDSSLYPNPTLRVDFGCLIPGCVYDSDGEPNSLAPGNFPFPGLRKYSLVLRVGSQVVQGGTNMNFITNQEGPLEICLNDDQLADNSGGWRIDISIDESHAR